MKKSNVTGVALYFKNLCRYSFPLNFFFIIFSGKTFRTSDGKKRGIPWRSVTLFVSWSYFFLSCRLFIFLLSHWTHFFKILNCFQWWYTKNVICKHKKLLTIDLLSAIVSVTFHIKEVRGTFHFLSSNKNSSIFITPHTRILTIWVSPLTFDWIQRKYLYRM